MAEDGMLVVARFLDGRLVKGRTADFGPTSSFHILQEGETEAIEVEVEDLKAIFFIKSLKGNPAHVERKDYREQGLGKKIWIQFLDGEELAGWSVTFNPEQESFRLFPADPESNIEMVYVFKSALRRVSVEEDAEIAAKEYQIRKQRSNSSILSPENWEGYLRI
jgi:hypothetical protein